MVLANSRGAATTTGVSARFSVFRFPLKPQRGFPFSVFRFPLKLVFFAFDFHGKRKTVNGKRSLPGGPPARDEKAQTPGRNNGGDRW